MSEEKRTYKSESITPPVLRLEPIRRKHNDFRNQPFDQQEPRKSIFTPELISRLTERIKKL